MKMQKLAGFFAAAFMAFSAVSKAAAPISADTESAVYVRTAAVPEAATEYTEDMLAHVSKSELRDLGLTSAEARSAKPGMGFRAKSADKAADTENVFYYPILSGGNMSALMTVTVQNNSGGYGFQLGKDNMITALGKVKTTPENPAEIYVSSSAFYAVTDNGAEVLSYGLSYKESDIKKEIAAIEKKRSEGGNSGDMIIAYGGKSGILKIEGKIYCIKDDGSIATGWQTVEDKKYYFKKDGSAAVKSTTIDGKRYKFGADGVCSGEYTGWVKSGSKRYCYKDGEKLTGWFSAAVINPLNSNVGGWYYADKKSGAVVTGSVEIDGKIQKFSETGLWENTNSITDSVCYSKLNRRLSKEDYGGVYIRNGGAYVVLSVNDKNVEAVVEDMREKYAQIEIKSCKFSVKQLESVKEHLSKNAKKYGITGMYTDVMKNQFVVEMKEKNAELEKYLDALDDRNIIRIEYGDFKIIED